MLPYRNYFPNTIQAPTLTTAGLLPVSNIFKSTPTPRYSDVADCDGSPRNYFLW